MKIFNIVVVDERAESGVSSIFDVWNNQEWKEPTIEEQFVPGRTVLTL